MVDNGAKSPCTQACKIPFPIVRNIWCPMSLDLFSGGTISEVLSPERQSSKKTAEYSALQLQICCFFSSYATSLKTRNEEEWRKNDNRYMHFSDWAKLIPEFVNLFL